MFSSIPLPNIEDATILSQVAKLNALQKQDLENKYYGPNIESEIANRNALTKGRNIENEYLPEKLKQANVFAQQQNKFYAPNILSEIANRNALTNKYNTMTPLEAQELKLKNALYPELTRAQIGAQNAMANLRNMGGSGVGVGGKDEALFQHQVALDNSHLKTPEEIYEASNVLRNGGNRLSNGKLLNPLSPAARTTMLRLQKGTTTSTLMNQAANLGDLAEQLNNTDIKPALKFTGIEGAAKLKAQKLRSGLGLPVTKDYLDYVGLQNEIIANMDSMRKALGTTVQPKYVKEFLGELTNPNSTVWNNPQTVKSKYDATLKWINNHAKNIANKIDYGVTSTSNNSEKGSSTPKKLTYNLETGEFS